MVVDQGHPVAEVAYQCGFSKSIHSRSMHKITFDLWGFVDQVVKIRVFRLIRSEQEQAEGVLDFV